MGRMVLRVGRVRPRERCNRQRNRSRSGGGSDSVAAGGPLISLDHVTVEFGCGKNRFRAVDDVSLTINKGSIYGIIGFSGAGKSTLVRTMNVLQRPTSGTVTFNGTTISTLGEGRCYRCAARLR